MPAAVTKGIVVSFGNTPQAANDTFGGLVNEDTDGTVLLNVMGNDEGGNAKTLWSIDDGASAGGIRPTDLLTQDVAGAVETSLLGAEISIVGGKVAYHLTTTLKNNLQSLAAGETAQDSFTYAIKLGNGTLSWATTTVTIAGTNDAASITGDSSGEATEDGPGASGVLVVSDVDHGEAHTKAASGNGVNGLGTYTVDSDGNWTYTADHDQNDHLAAGATATDSFTVDSLDGTAHQIVTVTIHGTNDAASIAGDTSGDATEDGAAATGTLDVSDVDDGEAHAAAATGAGATGLGAFSVDADGNWTYTADHAKNDHLAAGATATDSFTVDSKDGTAHQVVTVTIHGTNDVASITGTSSGAVTEDNATNTTGGTLSVSDVDDGENTFLAADNGKHAGSYGEFIVDTSTGEWSYALDNSNATVNALNDGGTLKDYLTVHSADGTDDQLIEVTINGHTDAPALTLHHATLAGDISHTWQQSDSPNGGNGGLNDASLSILGLLPDGYLNLHGTGSLEATSSGLTGTGGSADTIRASDASPTDWIGGAIQLNQGSPSDSRTLDSAALDDGQVNFNLQFGNNDEPTDSITVILHYSIGWDYYA